MPRIQVNLQEVVCFDPEEITGSGDEFYLIGAVSDGEQTEGVVTVPIQIDSNETKPFGVGGGVVFDHDVPSDRVLKVALTAFDEDAAKDWDKQAEYVDKIATAVAAGLTTIPNPYTAAAGAILPIAFKVVDGLFRLDKDDNLGQYTADFPVWSLAKGFNPQQWQFAGEWGGGWFGFSKWSYAVRYTILVL